MCPRCPGVIIVPVSGCLDLSGDLLVVKMFSLQMETVGAPPPPHVLWWVIVLMFIFKGCVLCARWHRSRSAFGIICSTLNGLTFFPSVTTYRCASPCHLLSPPSPILSLLPFAASSHARYFAPLLLLRGNLHPSGSSITDSRLTCTGDRRADVGRGAELSSKWRRMCALDTTGSYRRRAAFT